MNIRNKKRRMSGTNTYKENLLHNKQKQNVNNINIAFEPLETFKPRRTFMDSRHPRHYFLPMPKFHEPTLPTPPTPKIQTQKFQNKDNSLKIMLFCFSSLWLLAVSLVIDDKI